MKEEIDPHQALQLIHDYLDKHFEDVGADFYKEALKIHYGEAEKRNIKGNGHDGRRGHSKRGRGSILQSSNHQTSVELTHCCIKFEAWIIKTLRIKDTVKSIWPTESITPLCNDRVKVLEID